MSIERRLSVHLLMTLTPISLNLDSDHKDSWVDTNWTGADEVRLGSIEQQLTDSLRVRVLDGKEQDGQRNHGRVGISSTRQ